MMRTITADSRVAVVGGAGFLGSHLVDYLCDVKGCKVLVVDNLVAGKREFINPRAEFRHHDITGSEQYLYQLFLNRQIDYVFNYAAYPYIPDSFERPLHVCNVNFFGALKVINAAQEAGVKGILQISSAEIYGDKRVDGTSCKIDENEGIEPHSTYGASKAAIDYYCQCAWKERKTPVITLRQFNALGPRETHPYVIPEIISQLYHGENCTQYSPEKPYKDTKSQPCVRLGNNSTRDFLYAGDQAIMATELLGRGNFGEVYNLGSEQAITIYDLAQMISDVIGCGRVVIEEDPARKRPWEIWHLQSCNDKIYKTITARPTVSLKEALSHTISYYNDHGRKWCWEV